jgi:hypothetical protein
MAGRFWLSDEPWVAGLPPASGHASHAIVPAPLVLLGAGRLLAFHAIVARRNTAVALGLCARRPVDSEGENAAGFVDGGERRRRGAPWLGGEPGQSSGRHGQY